MCRAPLLRAAARCGAPAVRAAAAAAWLALGTAAAAAPPVLQWKCLAGWPAALAAVDSLVFIGSPGRGLEVRRAADGSRVWSAPAPGPQADGLDVAGDLLVSVEPGGQIAARRAATGELLWRRRLAAAVRPHVHPAAAVAAIATAGGVTALLDAGDGREVGRLRSGLRGTPVVFGGPGSWWAGTAAGLLLRADVRTGQRLGRVEMGARLRTGWATGGVAIAGCGDGYVRAYGADDLAPAWQRRLGAPLRAAPLLLEGVAVVAAGSGWVYGLAGTDGAVRWKHRLDAAPADAVLVPGPAVVVATGDGRLVALAPATGAVQWQLDLLPGRGLRLVAAGAALGALADDGYLYVLGPDTAPAAAAGDQWWALYNGGRRTGYRRVHSSGASGSALEAVEEAVEEAVGWRSGFVRTRTEVAVDTASRLQRLDHRRLEDTQVLWRQAERRGDTLFWTDCIGAATGGGAVVVPPEALQPEAVLPARLARAADPRTTEAHSDGEAATDSLLVFDFESLSLRRVAMQVEAAAPEAAPAAQVLRLCMGPELPLLAPDGADARPRVHTVDVMAGLEFVEWLDGDGQPLRSAVPALGLSQKRLPGPRARAWEPPGPARAVRLDHPVPEAARLDCVAIALPAELAHLFPASRRQTVVSDSGRAVLVVRRSRLDEKPGAGPSAPADSLAPYLAPSLYASSDHRRIRELAARLAAGEPDPVRRARRLHDWVYDHMRPAATPVHFKTALEVLDEMEGTCSEYAVLFIALSRAAGLPARAAAGFAIAADGDLVLHIWPQVHLGSWVDVDPSWNAFPVAASHLATGWGRLTPAGIARLNLPLQMLVARADTLSLTAYRRGEVRFLGRAEALFTAAERADRDFEAERALELYHQLTLLPWNRRSAQAYVEIGRYRQRQEEPGEARWAFERLLRLDPSGPRADAAHYYLARLEEKAGDVAAATARLEGLVRDYPDGDLADDALGHLGELLERTAGCGRAGPVYERLREEYPASGWAHVAASGLRRCGLLPGADEGVD